MPTVAFTTLGCKVNQYETQRILDSFEEAGFEVTLFEQPADVYVINTCSVTSAAESKSRYAVRRARRFNDQAVVVVTGCAAQMSLNKSETFDGADVLVPNPEKLSTLDMLLSVRPGLRPTEARAAKSSRESRTRATLKIQDGCSVMCSYCSIPYTRPGLKSRPWSEVVEEAARMVASGYREIVLTGVLIGAYGPDSGSGGPDFEDLVERLADVQGLARLRISSIEMRQVTPRLIDLLRSGKVAPHLHIPLQSGDDCVLADMNRPYRRADYLDLVERLYDEVLDFSLTTDVMVGFPTETDERFASTEALFHDARYLKAHVFRFSPRYGTPADRFGDPVPDKVKQARAEALTRIATETGRGHAARFVGRTLRVLVEGKMTREGLLEGLTDNYLTVRFAGPQAWMRTLRWVRLDEERDGVLFGEAVPGPPTLRLV